MNRSALPAALAVLALVLVVPAGASAGLQTITASMNPSKLDKKKFAKVGTSTDIKTATDTSLNPNLDQPPSQTRTRIDLPKNLKFDFKAGPLCKVSANQLASMNTEQAVKACGAKSKITVNSGTSATLVIDPQPTMPFSTPSEYEVSVVGFNGDKPGTLFLHTRVDELSSTVMVVGKFKKAPKGYGMTLDIPVPPLALGAISEFRTEFKRAATNLARCKAKTNRWRVRTDYSNAPSSVATFQSPCKRR